MYSCLPAVHPLQTISNAKSTTTFVEPASSHTLLLLTARKIATCIGEFPIEELKCLPAMVLAIVCVFLDMSQLFEFEHQWEAKSGFQLEFNLIWRKIYLLNRGWIPIREQAADVIWRDKVLHYHAPSIGFPHPKTCWRGMSLELTFMLFQLFEKFVVHSVPFKFHGIQRCTAHSILCGVEMWVG